MYESSKLTTPLNGFTKGKGCTKFGKNRTEIVAKIVLTDNTSI